MIKVYNLTIGDNGYGVLKLDNLNDGVYNVELSSHDKDYFDNYYLTDYNYSYNYSANAIIKVNKVPAFSMLMILKLYIIQENI